MTSDRCSGRCGVISYALLRQPYLRPRRCGDLGFVTRHKPTEHHIAMFLHLQTLRRHVSRPVAAGASLSARRCGVTVCLQLRRSYLVFPFFFFREWFFLLDGVNLLVLLKLTATQLLCFPLQSSFRLQAFPEDEVSDTGCSKLVAEHAEEVVPRRQLRVG